MYMYLNDSDKAEITRIENEYGVGVVFDQASHDKLRRVKKGERVWNVSDSWGNGINEGEIGEGEYVRFHPGRDIKWKYDRVGPQAMMLQDAGLITFDSLYFNGALRPNNLFKGAQGLEDFANVIDLCDGRDARVVLDIAPDIFIAQELIKQTGAVVEERRVKLTLRDFFPFEIYNTWFTQYRFDRVEERGHGFSLPVDINSMAGIPTPKQSESRTPVYRPLYHHYSGAMWSDLELEQFAEARANGAPDLDIIRRRSAKGQRDIKRTENCLGYYGHPDMDGFDGALNNPEIANIPASQMLGANALPEEDRALIVDVVCAIFEASIDNASIDMILVGTRAWCYLNKTIYFGSDNGNSDSRTLLSVIMEAVAPMGVKRIEWAPELEFRQLQATRLENEHGFSQALAERWSGGRRVGGVQQNTIFFMNSSRDTGSVGLGKELAVRPLERFRGDNEQRYLASSGSFDVREPAFYRTLSNVGPI